MVFGPERKEESKQKHHDRVEPLDDSELETVSGGYGKIMLCAECRHHIAVEGMNICARCFRRNYQHE